jgi:UDP-N-acetylglucosamine 2-epimerase
MRMVSVVGARPQFVKLGPVCRAFQRFPSATHRIVHTGQHYDDAMSGAFFRDLGIPAPAVNLEVGSGSHASQTAEMMRRLETVLQAESPDWVLLYGDTNSTLAGALTAAKLHLRCAHIESGLRSFNRSMPEEINRVVTDHVSDVLFCPTDSAMENLRREGLAERAVLTGDIMLDAIVAVAGAAEAGTDSAAFQWQQRSYALATIHRAENTDDVARLRALLDALEEISSRICPVVLAIHPRTEKMVATLGWKADKITIIPPLSYPDMILFEKRARMILTDSGGVQKEAYILNVPCITLRNETEWVETLGNSCNTITGADPVRILQAARNADAAGPWASYYGNGNAAGCIVQDLVSR